MKVERCPVCKRRMRRSNEANARLWLLYHLIAEKIRPDGKTFSAETWHCFFKMRFLGCDEVRLPNRKIAQIPRSTAALDMDEFSLYMQKVEEWARDRDVWLPDIENAA